MNPEEIGGLEPEVARRAYYNQAPWKRIAVILAGPGREHPDRVRALLGDPRLGQPRRRIDARNLNPSIHTVARDTRSGRSRSGAARPHGRAASRRPDHRGRRPPASVDVRRRASQRDRCAGAQVNGCPAARPCASTVSARATTLTFGATPATTRSKRMLIGFNFGVTAKPFGRVRGRRAARREMWTRPPARSRRRPRVHELQGPPAAHSIVGITENRPRNVRRRRRLRARVPRLHLAGAGRHQPVPVPAARRRPRPVVAGREGARQAHLARAMYRYSSVGIVLLLFLVINGISNDIGRLGG